MFWKQENDWVRRKYFHRCRFKKGGGSSTTVQSYQPTAEEKRLWTQQADYTDAVAPNALALNNYAMGLLKDSLGTVQVDYNTMNKNAQNQINNAMGNMAALAGSNNATANAANSALTNIGNQAGALAGNASAAYGDLAGQYTAAGNNAQSGYNNMVGQLASANNEAKTGYNNLRGLYTDAGSSAQNGYNNLAGIYTGAANKTNETLDSLTSGVLPNAYQSNMERSIQSALDNTIGKTVNNLANKGVINSSVTSSALNDIEKNAADAVAQQYQQNINQAGSLAQQQYSNTANTANSLGELIGKNYSIGTDTANSLGELIGKNYSIDTDTTQNMGDLIGKTYSVGTDVANNLGNVIDRQHGVVSDALGQQAQYAQQQFENSQNANSQNSGIYSNLINSATQPITTAATAQDAAITPAQALWNTSLGLNGAGTSALGVMGGKGTTTSTQTFNTGGSGGGLFSGLLGGVANGYANAFGGSLFCFPAGTMISMADGTEKDIKDIEIDDKVATDSGDEAIVVEVMESHYNEVYEVVCEGGSVKTTATQPLMLADGNNYIFAGDLTEGVELRRVGKVQDVHFVRNMKVYDFKTSGDNQYIANGFVAMGGDGAIWGGGN